MKVLYDNNKVSVIMPIFNPTEYLKESIESVLEQTYLDIELWLIDDASTKPYLQVINEYLKFENVHFLQLEINSGPAIARNLGIEKSVGRYIAFIDADDLWRKDKLAKQLKKMNEDKLVLSFSDYEVVSSDGTKSIKRIKGPEFIDYVGLLKNTIIGCSTVVIDRSKLGDFRMPEIRGSEDTATWLSILKKGYQAGCVQEVLVDYRLIDTSFSRNKWHMLFRTWKMYRKTQNLSIFLTSYYFSWYVFHAIKKRI